LDSVPRARSLLILLFLVLFHCSCAAPYLPSFPTRRSSDLDFGVWLFATGGTALGKVNSSNDSAKSNLSRRKFLRGSAAAGGVARSEEHTSELQSRGHLVCRLLLEKKKEGEARARVGRRQDE